QPLRSDVGRGGQQSLQRDPVVRPGDHPDRYPIGWAQDLQAVIGTAVHGADEPRRSVVIAANGKRILATGRQGKQPVAGRGWPGGELVIGSFRSPANQAAQVSLVSGDATDHEDSVLSVDVDDVDAAYALAR